MSETVSDDELFTILLLSIPPVLRPDQNVFRAGLRAVFNAGRVLSAPSREAIAEALKVGMLGTTDGDFIDPSSEIPAGEMYRLALDAVVALMKENQ